MRRYGTRRKNKENSKDKIEKGNNIDKMNQRKCRRKRKLKGAWIWKAQSGKQRKEERCGTHGTTKCIIVGTNADDRQQEEKHGDTKRSKKRSRRGRGKKGRKDTEEIDGGKGDGRCA